MPALLEVVVTFADTVVDVVHLGLRRRSFVIGEGSEVDLAIPRVGERFELLRASGDRLELLACEGLDGFVSEAGRRRPLEHGRVELAAGTEAMIVCGGARLRVRVVEAEPMRWRARPVDLGLLASLFVSAAIALAYGSLARSIPSREAIAEIEPEVPAYVRYFPRSVTVAEVARERLPEIPQPVECDDSAVPGTPKGAVGGGKKTSRPSRPAAGKSRGRGARRVAEPELQRRSEGILGLLAQQGTHSLPPAFAVGPGSDDGVWGSFAGEGSGRSWDGGGLGLLGPGGGGGGAGGGRIEGVGGLGLVGAGGIGTGLELGIVGCACKPKREHKREAAKRPTVRLGATVVSGAGTRQTARRVAHGQLGELRRCYAASSPSAALELELTMLLGAGGRVQRVVVEGPGARSIDGCLTKAVDRWRFPTELGVNSIVRQTLKFELR